MIIIIRFGIIFNKSELGQPIRSWLITFLQLTHYVPLRPWRWTVLVHQIWLDKTPWQIWTKSTNPQLSYLRFINLCRRFFVVFAVFQCRPSLTHRQMYTSSKRRGLNFTKIGENGGQSLNPNFRFQISYPVSKRGRLKVECGKNRGEIAHFYPPPCKN